ncbi:Translationally controlled tumor protein [Phytophthora cactorum]|nr:Translationally controlled tumor protein [Phytophthora cactorum]
MLVWQDVFTEDEVMSDSNKVGPCKDMEGNEVSGMFQVESKTVAKGADNVDIGCGDAFGGDDDQVDDSVETVNNVIDDSIGFGYIETGFDTKAELKTYLKSYFRKVMKNIKSSGASDETLAQFKSDAQEIVKFLVSMFKELQFYMFKSCDSEAGLAYAYYPEGAVAPPSATSSGASRRSSSKRVFER